MQKFQIKHNFTPFIIKDKFKKYFKKKINKFQMNKNGNK